MISVFEHPWLGGLFSDDAAAALWSPDAQVDHWIAFETALARAGRISAEDADAAKAVLRRFRADHGRLRARTGVDGLPIPEFVRQLRAEAGAPKAALHAGATSQDVLDTALALTLRGLTGLLLARLDAVAATLADLRLTHGAARLMGRTRMQAALPITVGDRIDAWRAPLVEHAARLAALRPGVERLQLGGPVGTAEAFGADAAAIATTMAGMLGLNVAQRVWHTDRSAIVDYAHRLSLISGSLGKMGQDVALMAQQGLDEAAFRGGGASSAMPHKSNPVRAELLVTLARFNATLIAGMHHAMIHEQERSGAAWTLEWMILPQIAVATARALSAASELLAEVARLGPEG